MIAASSSGTCAAASYAVARLNEPGVRTIAALRDALLPKLISGELRITHATNKHEAHSYQFGD